MLDKTGFNPSIVVDAHNIVMKDGKTRLVFREFFLEQFKAMWGIVSALDALIREVKLSIEMSIHMRA